MQMRHVGMHVSGKGCMNASTHATLQYIAMDAKTCNLSCMHSCMHVYVHVCKKTQLYMHAKPYPCMQYITSRPLANFFAAPLQPSLA